MYFVTKLGRCVATIESDEVAITNYELHTCIYLMRCIPAYKWVIITRLMFATDGRQDANTQYRTSQTLVHCSVKPLFSKTLILFIYLLN